MQSLRIIIRSLKKNFIYTWTNILSLAIAFCFVFLTALYVIHEYTFDQGYPESEKIHRLVSVGSNLSNTRDSHPFILSEGYQESNPSIESVVRAYNNPYLSNLVRNKEEWQSAFSESGFWYVEQDFLTMFNVQLETGSFAMFDVPGTVLISRSVNDKLFEGGNSIGKKIVIETDELEIIGVYEDFPSNASLDPRFIVSMKTMKSKETFRKYFERTGYLMFKVFVSAQDGTIIKDLEEELNTSTPKSESFSNSSRLALEPITAYHFSDLDIGRSYRDKADRQLVIWLVVISICLLAVAVANFGNISLAIGIGRMKEIAIKKVIGATRSKLIRESLSQSLLLSLISFFGALILIESLMPLYGRFVQRELSGGMFGVWPYFGLFIFICIVALLAGTYPALIVSNFKVSRLFSSFGERVKPQSVIGKVLLSFQFLIAFGVLSTMLFMNRQLTFMLSKDPGYNFENTLVLRSNWFQGRDENRIQTFEDQLMAMPEVLDLAISDEQPMRLLSLRDLRPAGRRDGWEKANLFKVGIDCRFLDFYDIANNFDDNVISMFCSKSKIGFLNEAAFSMLENEPVGKRLPESYGQGKPGYIIQEGAVSDFHFTSVHESIPAMLFRPISMSDGRAHFSIRYSENANLGELINRLQTLWWD